MGSTFILEKFGCWVRSPPRDPEDPESGCPRQGCGNMKLRHQSNNISERLTSFPRVTDTEKTMLRSPSGPIR